MAPLLTENSITEEHPQTRFIRRSRNQNNNTPPSPQLSPLLQPTGCKPTISSLFFSTNKKKNFTSSTFRGLGCTSSVHSQATTPTAVVIRSSADWQAKKMRKKKHKKKKKSQDINGGSPSSGIVVPDVWCAPGIGFAAAAAATSDCVVSRRVAQERGRSDGGERLNHRERSTIVRRAPNLDPISILGSPSDIATPRFGSDVHGARHHRHFRHRSPGGLAEIMMFESSLMMGRRLDGYDRHRDCRLDVDRMSYEELLELEDKIGYVSTGLREDEILRCLRKTKHAILDALSSRFSSEIDWNCSICQEEYETGDEVGKLECSHSYHLGCIKQWLLQKNTCPVCKVAAVLHTDDRRESTTQFLPK